MINLRPRLLVIAERIPHGARVVDVGTDHGKLPLWLLQNGVMNDVVGIDIAEAPLAKARLLAEKHGVGLDLRKSDGLQNIIASDVDTIVIAGMGGETMIDILAAAPWSMTKLLLLQPMSRSERLLAWLNGQKLVVNEMIVQESRRKFYLFEAKP